VKRWIIYIYILLRERIYATAIPHYSIIPVYNAEVLIDQLYKRTTAALEALQREYTRLFVWTMAAMTSR